MPGQDRAPVASEVPMGVTRKPTSVSYENSLEAAREHTGKRMGQSAREGPKMFQTDLTHARNFQAKQGSTGEVFAHKKVLELVNPLPK